MRVVQIRAGIYATHGGIIWNARLGWYAQPILRVEGDDYVLSPRLGPFPSRLRALDALAKASASQETKHADT